LTRIPVEAIEGLEEVVTRWLDQRIGELREELGAERVERQNADEAIRDSLQTLSHQLENVAGQLS
jgi:hypothetical protein